MLNSLPKCFETVKNALQMRGYANLQFVINHLVDVNIYKGADKKSVGNREVAFETMQIGKC